MNPLPRPLGTGGPGPQNRGVLPDPREARPWVSNSSHRLGLALGAEACLLPSRAQHLGTGWKLPRYSEQLVTRTPLPGCVITELIWTGHCPQPGGGVRAHLPQEGGDEAGGPLDSSQVGPRVSRGTAHGSQALATERVCAQGTQVPGALETGIWVGMCTACSCTPYTPPTHASEQGRLRVRTGSPPTPHTPARRHTQVCTFEALTLRRGAGGRFFSGRKTPPPTPGRKENTQTPWSPGYAHTSLKTTQMTKRASVSA